MNLYIKKISLIKALKAFLNENGFTEVITPTLRQDGGKIIERVPLKAEHFLRDSHELQLRALLSCYPSVYEIGSCFRNEDTIKKSTNLFEFLLMELFSSKHDLSDLMNLTKEFILEQRPDIDFVEISVAESIRADTGVNLFCEPQENLYAFFRRKYGSSKFDYDFEYVEHYIDTELVPLSRGKIVFFTQYPECLCSYANILEGNVTSRFELFANGIELANAFDDECCVDRFIQRNKDLPLFEREEKLIANMLKEEKLPTHSAGIGIGIERLCMFLCNGAEITDFSFPFDSF